MSELSLIERLSVARGRLAEHVPDLAQVSFDNEPAQVAHWLDTAAQAALAREYVVSISDDEPACLYLWLNEFTIHSEWSLSAMARGPAVAPEDAYDWLDRFIGEEIGDLRVPRLSLSGMGDVQAWFVDDRAAKPAARGALEEVVLLAAFDLVGRSLQHAPAVQLQVAVSRGDEPRLCLWERPDAGPRLIDATALHGPAD